MSGELIGRSSEGAVVRGSGREGDCEGGAACCCSEGAVVRGSLQVSVKEESRRRGRIKKLWKFLGDYLN